MSSQSDMENDKKLREETILDCLKAIVASNEADKAMQGLDILHKLIANILKNPTEEKFRIFKKSNKAIQAKLMSLQPQDKINQLLEALGYVEVDPECSAFVGNYFPILNFGAVHIEEQAIELKMLFMTDDERKKQEIIL